jgi:hypothetical protein
MALYACRECERDVSDQAKACQHCGCPTASKDVWKSLNELNAPITYIFLLIGLLVLFVLMNPEYFLKGVTSDKLSHLGDFFGGLLNPLLTFISVILLITTLKLTRDSVDISKRELTLSRQAMSESAIALKEQAGSLEVQNFNSLFFNLLKYHDAVASSLTFEASKGRHCFKAVNSDLDYRFSEYDDFPILLSSLSVPPPHFASDYDFFVNSHDIYTTPVDNLDKYMLSLRTILKTIDKTTHVIRKHEYVDIIRSQLSRDEVLIVLYYAECMPLESPLKLLLEKYNFQQDAYYAEGSRNVVFDVVLSAYKTNS